MTSRPMLGFALGALASSAVGAALLAPWVESAGAIARPWAVAGFVAMAVPGIAGGAWLAHEHGRPASWFLIALATGFVARLVLAAVAAFYAATAGNGAGAALIAGLAAGFVPLTVFEMIWFLRAPRAHHLETETRG